MSGVIAFIRVHASYVSTIVLLLVGIVAVYIDGLEIPKDVVIFYFPMGITLLYWSKCLTFPLVLILLSIWGNKGAKQLRRWQFSTALVFILLLFFLSLAFQYVAAWAVSSIQHVTSARFQGNVYHIARIVQFDEVEKYYFGKCDITGYRCQFHEVFSSISSNQMKLSTSLQNLVISENGEVIYTFDGEQETCMSNDYVFCSINPYSE